MSGPINCNFLHVGRQCRIIGRRKLIDDNYIAACENRRKSVERALTVLFTAANGPDVRPQRVNATFDIEHLISIHKYLFGDLYEWAGEFRDENLYKSERVLSGGSAEYADYQEIERKLNLQKAA